jgi:hypothetical protein
MLDKKLAYENTISERIKQFSNEKAMAQSRAASVGCEMSILPMEGSSYFENNPQNDKIYMENDFDLVSTSSQSMSSASNRQRGYC